MGCLHPPPPSQGPLGLQVLNPMTGVGSWGGFWAFFHLPFSTGKSTPFWMGFLDRLLLQQIPQMDQKSIKSCFFRYFFSNAFFRRFSQISARFSRSPNLKYRAPVYTGTRLSKNRRFRFRISFWMDFSSFWPHFRPDNARKWAPGPSRERSRLSVPILSISGSISGPI